MNDELIEEDFLMWQDIVGHDLSIMRGDLGGCLESLSPEKAVEERRAALFCLNFFHPITVEVAAKVASLVTTNTNEGIKGSAITYCSQAFAGSCNVEISKMLSHVIMDDREAISVRCVAYHALLKINTTGKFKISLLDIQSPNDFDLKYIRRFI